MLLAQAFLYRALSRPDELQRGNWQISDILLSPKERAIPDWREPSSAISEEAAVSGPVTASEQYLSARLYTRLRGVEATSNLN
jgi:hypothetical protein